MRARAGVGRGLGGPGVRHRALRERSRVPAILVRVPVSAVLFDLDDTLLDAEAAWRSGVGELVAIRAPGLGLDLTTAIQAWGEVFPEWFERYLVGEISMQASRAGRIRDWSRLLGLQVRDGEEAAWFDSYVAGYQRGWAPFADVLPALTALAPLPLGLVTNGDGIQQRQKVAALGLESRFAAVVVSSDVGVPKPDPAIFLAAASALRVDPAECVMVGDLLDRDVAGALAAGMGAVWLRRPDGPQADMVVPQELAGRFQTLATLVELPAVLASWPDGVEAVGVDAVGVDAVGVDAVGVEAVGVEAVGVDAVGVDAVGVDAAAGA